MDNTKLPADFKNPFKKGEYIKHESNIILVTGNGDHVAMCAGVIIESDESWHPVGSYSKTWHAWKFEKVEYANKLHQVEEENERLNASCNKMFKQNCRFNNDLVDAKNLNAAARALLEKIASRHEGGLLPDRLLYNEIKKFLDGK